MQAADKGLEEDKGQFAWTDDDDDITQPGERTDDRANEHTAELAADYTAERADEEMKCGAALLQHQSEEGGQIHSQEYLSLSQNADVLMQ